MKTTKNNKLCCVYNMPKRFLNVNIIIFFAIMLSSCKKSPSTFCIINNTKNIVKKMIVNPSNKEQAFLYKYIMIMGIF